MKSDTCIDSEREEADGLGPRSLQNAATGGETANKALNMENLKDLQTR